MRPILHGYWRSTASYRVRIALALKGLDHDQVARDLRRGEQRTAAYLAVAPQGLTPALDVEGMVLTQSLAIIEWLDERVPEPALLPKSANDRAIVRGMAQIVVCDIHPLNNLRVLQTLRTDLSIGEDQIQGWIARWIGEGFFALEGMAERYGGEFSFGDEPTLADCVLIPQIYSARRYGVDLKPFPRLVAIGSRASASTAFEAAHPDRQADADL